MNLDKYHRRRQDPVVRGDLYGTRVEWPERQPMLRPLMLGWEPSRIARNGGSELATPVPCPLLVSYRT